MNANLAIGIFAFATVYGLPVICALVAMHMLASRAFSDAAKLIRLLKAKQRPPRAA